ncbi:patatin family protein [Abiotrophia defectiva]|uniref:patatin-like phospholipase family protein n=1 Tax=Abiotrophia defectiva TaxID=46125 RepID=UPI0028D110CA|nr:patatin family protein [Abiotrophia defectiva]
MRIGMVFEGGGMRGLYSAGVLDSLMAAQIPVDEIVAVSAGALFGVNYVSGQVGRAWRYNKRYLGDKRYMSLSSWLKTGNYVNKDFAYYQVPMTLDPFDNERFKASPTRFHAVVTHVASGKAEYALIEDAFDQMEVLRASSALPFVSKMIQLDASPDLTGGAYLDGGISDSIPVHYARQLDVDKLIVVLTRPASYRKATRSNPLYSIVYRRFPALVQALNQRGYHYNQTLDQIETMEAQGELFVIRPSAHLEVGRFERDIRVLESLYNLGRQDGQNQINPLEIYLQT